MHRKRDPGARFRAALVVDRPRRRHEIAVPRNEDGENVLAVSEKQSCDEPIDLCGDEPCSLVLVLPEESTKR